MNSSHTVSAKRQKQIRSQVLGKASMLKNEFASSLQGHCFGSYADELKNAPETPAEWAYYKYCLATLGIEYDAMVASITEYRDLSISKCCSHTLELHAHGTPGAKLVISTCDGRVVERHSGDFHHESFPDIGAALRSIEIAWWTRTQARMSALRLRLFIDQPELLQEDFHQCLTELARGYAIRLELLFVHRDNNRSRWAVDGETVVEANYDTLIEKLQQTSTRKRGIELCVDGWTCGVTIRVEKDIDDADQL
jgi:hypothetical protein